MLRSIHTPAVVLAGLLTVGLVGTGCKDMMGKKDDSSSMSKTADASGKTLYERLGGHDAIVAVVADFVGRADNDPKVNFTRQNPPHDHQWQATPGNVARLKTLLVQFIETNTGGPKNYTGRDMESSHRGMNITEAEFNALAGHLKDSLDKFKVPQREQTELINIVASTKPQIVGK